jgi:hypothetical protein
VFAYKDPLPIAVLREPVVLENKAFLPKASFSVPVVLVFNAL